MTGQERHKMKSGGYTILEVEAREKDAYLRGVSNGRTIEKNGYARGYRAGQRKAKQETVHDYVNTKHMQVLLYEARRELKFAADCLPAFTESSKVLHELADRIDRFFKKGETDVAKKLSRSQKSKTAGRTGTRESKVTNAPGSTGSKRVERRRKAQG